MGAWPECLLVARGLFDSPRLLVARGAACNRGESKSPRATRHAPLCSAKNGDTGRPASCGRSTLGRSRRLGRSGSTRLKPRCRSARPAIVHLKACRGGRARYRCRSSCASTACATAVWARARASLVPDASALGARAQRKRSGRRRAGTEAGRAGGKQKTETKLQKPGSPQIHSIFKYGRWEITGTRMAKTASLISRRSLSVLPSRCTGSRWLVEPSLRATRLTAGPS